MDNYVNAKSTGEANGKSIILSSEICYSWGFGGKKKAIEEIVKNLTNLGYDVNYVITPVKGRTNVYNLTVHVDNDTEILVFSNNKNDNPVVLANNPSLKIKEIIEKIVSVS